MRLPESPEPISGPGSDSPGLLIRVQSLLRQRLGAGGCTARARDFAYAIQGDLAYLHGIPEAPDAALNELNLHLVEEALQTLWDAGEVEMHCLADGALVYRFPRR